jgi:2'-5' RNA ligase
VNAAPLRTALSILLGEAAPEVAAARAELDPEAALRIPLHVTLLFPFVPRDEVTAGIVAELRTFFAAQTSPSFELTRVATFPGVVTYAAPEPAAGLVRLMAALWARYPDLPPYGGGVTEPVPHATLTRLDLGAAPTVERVLERVEPLLPVACAPRAASLVEEYEPDRWRELEQLAFAAAVPTT